MYIYVVILPVDLKTISVLVIYTFYSGYRFTKRVVKTAIGRKIQCQLLPGLGQTHTKCFAAPPVDSANRFSYKTVRNNQKCDYEEETFSPWTCKFNVGSIDPPTVGFG